MGQWPPGQMLRRIFNFSGAASTTTLECAATTRTRPCPPSAPRRVEAIPAMGTANASYHNTVTGASKSVYSMCMIVFGLFLDFSMFHDSMQKDSMGTLLQQLAMALTGDFYISRQKAAFSMHTFSAGWDFWRIKNSWGTDKGVEGYHRVFRGVGHCGVGSFWMQPICV